MPKKIAKKPKKSVFRFWGKIILSLSVGIVILIGLVDLFAAFILSSNYYLNYSLSMPIGFYKVAAPDVLKKGDDVIVCLPEAIAQEGLKRLYLNLGDCPGGSSYIIKQLIAIPGDSVTLTTREMIVNNDQAYFAPIKRVDHEGRLVSAIPRGSYQNTTSYWLYGVDDLKDSWDSRYWGGVSKENIVKVAHPVLTFK